MVGDERDWIGPAPATTEPAVRPLAPTVYEQISVLLRERGWAQGRSRRGNAVCLMTAIDEVVGLVGDCRTAPDGPKLARAGLIGRHLRDLARVRNLAEWSDDRTRTVDDVMELLDHASIAFPDD